MAVFKIKKGKGLAITGKPSSEIANAASSKKYTLLPPDFEGRKFKLEVKVGDEVKVGTPLLSDRVNNRIVYTSPAGGKVVEINRGEKRKILEVVVETGGSEEFKEFPVHSGQQISGLERSSLIDLLLESGLWPFIIQRPFSRIADPEAVPKSIFINAMDTEPNCADKQVLLNGHENSFQAGIEALKRLTEGKVHLCWDGRASSAASALANASGVEKHQFTGPHPAGCVGTHIHYIDPINKGDVVWHVNAEHCSLIGKFLLEGKVPVERLVAVAGSSATQRKYYRTRAGASLESIIQGNVEKGPVRHINGGVLTGKQVSAGSYLGFYNSTVTMIPEDESKELMGWLMPGFGKSTFSRMFASAFLPLKMRNMNTKLNGERRAIVATHVYDPLVALRLHTVFLVKACIAKDVEDMEELGLLECAPEDFALCTYACVSKVEVDTIIREGLDLLEKES
jgi:Na+-transporting NADH:ubiquinone oxidoreductase subunit A